MTKEIKELAESIAATNGGAHVLNLTQAARVVGKWRGKMPEWLKEWGVPIQKHGNKEKKVLVSDLAEGILRPKEKTQIST